MILVKTKSNQDRFQGLFDSLFSPEWNMSRGDSVSTHTSFPKVNIKDGDKEFLLEIASPGMEKGDFKIQLDQRILTVSSGKKEENLKGDQRYSKKEFSYLTFQRAFSLPDIADTENINASYLNGVLLIRIPKKEEAKPEPRKSIKVA